MSIYVRQNGKLVIPDYLLRELALEIGVDRAWELLRRDRAAMEAELRRAKSRLRRQWLVGEGLNPGESG